MAEKTINQLEIDIMIEAVNNLTDIMLDSEAAYTELEKKAIEIFGENYTERQLKAVYLFGSEASNLAQHI